MLVCEFASGWLRELVQLEISFRWGIQIISRFAAQVINIKYSKATLSSHIYPLLSICPSFTSLSSIPPWQIFPSISYPWVERATFAFVALSFRFQSLVALNSCSAAASSPLSSSLPLPHFASFLRLLSCLLPHTLFSGPLSPKNIRVSRYSYFTHTVYTRGHKNRNLFFFFFCIPWKESFLAYIFVVYKDIFYFYLFISFYIFFFDVFLAQVLFASAREKKVWQKYFCFFTCEWMLKLFFSSFAAFLHHLCFSSSPIRALSLAFLHTFWS